MLKRKATPAPTMNDRLANAQALRTAALASFESAVTDLEYAADEQRELANEALAEAHRMTELAATAVSSAEANEKAASKIRALLS